MSSNAWRYAIADGKLAVSHSDEPGTVVWAGRMDDSAILSVIQLPGSGDCVALLDYSAGSSFGVKQNVVRYRHPQGVVWRASPPGTASTDGFDAYIALALEEGKLNAQSWSGYRVTLDVRNGRITTSEFTK